MTIHSAINVLKMVEAHDSLSIKAKAKAIKSLEAWAEVLEELSALEEQAGRKSKGTYTRFREMIERKMEDVEHE